MAPSSASNSASASASASLWARGLAGVPGGVLAFAALCLLALLAVACGVLFEIGRARRESASESRSSAGSVIGRAQFGWRLASALVWCAALALLAYASSWGWPRRGLGLGLDGRGWLQVLGWAMIFIFIGLVLLAQDLWRVRARASAQEAAFRTGLSLLAQQEIERAQNPNPPRPKNFSPDTSDLS